MDGGPQELYVTSMTEGITACGPRASQPSDEKGGQIMTGRAASSGVSRRDFIRLAGMGVAAFGVAACTGGNGASTATSSPGAASSGAATPGGILRVSAADGSPNDTLDPLRMERAFQILATPKIYESLVDLDEDFQPHPRLAASFEPANGGQRWVFDLQEGVTYHDGSPLTAADVVYCITRALDPEEGSGNSLAGQLEGVLLPSGIKALDDRTIQFDLEKEYVFFPNAMATRFARIYQEGTTDFTRPNGTGPFRFVSFTPGQRLVTERNPDYWRGEVLLDRYELTNVTDDAARISSLLAGDLDLIFEIALASAPDITSSTDHTLLEQANAAWIPLGIDSTVEPFDNPDLVRAIKLAVDRQQVIDNAYGGFGSIGYDTPVAEQDAYFAGLPTPMRDLDAAREALADAGYPNGVDLPTLIPVDVPNVVAFATVVQQQLAEVGIRFDVERESSATYWDDTWLVKPYYSNDYLRRHPDEIMKLVWLSNGPWNMSKREDPEIDAAIVAAGQTTDFDEQKEQYGIAQRLIAERDTTVIPAHLPRLSGMSARLQGVTTNPVYFLDIDQASFA
jgi:peptide/nickel transport system substrate-binding protein